MKLSTIASSADPQKVSVAVRGFLLLAVVPIIRLVVSLKGGVFNDEATKEFVDAVAKLTELAVSLLAAGMIVYGYIRKAIAWVQQNFAKS